MSPSSGGRLRFKAVVCWVAGGEGVGMGQQADGQGWLYSVVNRCLEHTSVRPGVSVAFMPLRGLKFVVTFQMGRARRCGIRPHLTGS